MRIQADWQHLLGGFLGVTMALVVIALTSAAPGTPGTRDRHPPGDLVADSDGSLRDLVIHYVPDAGAAVDVAYREFLRQLPPTATVHVLTPDADAFAEFAQRIGAVRCCLEPCPVEHPVTPWSRDRWLAISGRRGVTLLTPAAEMAAELWPARKGDGRTAADLASRYPRWVTAQRSGLSFDGGDFVTDGQTVFVSPQVIERNVGLTVATSEELSQRLEQVLGAEVVLLSGGPRHHAGMFMMAAGARRVVVGDPATAAGLYAAAGRPVPEWADNSSALQAAFDAVASHCRNAGYDVRRVPCVAGRDGRTYLTYVNVIIDGGEAQRIVYMPVYDEADTLNAAAEAVWCDLGFTVRRVNCSAVYPHFGSLRCLVNVLRRA